MPGIAPRMMAWRRRAGGLPGRVGASGEAFNGQPVMVEMLVNGVWVDITPYVMVRDDQGKITISKGIRDEGNQTEQSTGSLPLKNPDGRFTPRNPVGAYYPYIGRNTPMRISVPDGMGGKSYRARPESPKWPRSWDPSGTDVWVDVASAGILQRLSQAPAPEHSVIYTAVTDPVPASVVAYWPMEDPSGSTQLTSPLASGSPMTWSGTPTLASYEGFSASDPLPYITSAALSGGVARYDDPTATQVRFLVYIPKAGLSDGKVVCAIDQLDYSAGSTQFWELYYGNFTGTSTSFTLRTCAADGTNLGADLEHTLDVRGRLLYVSVEFQENGSGGVNQAIRLVDVPTGRVYSVTDTANLTQLVRVTKVQFGPASRSVVGPTSTANLPGVAVGHCTVENAVTAINALGIRLNPIGETAGRRIQRLCAEEGIPFDWTGDLDDTVAMGAQPKLNPLSAMQECVLADGGILFENLAVLGLGYRTRTSLYNQDPALTLNYAGYNLAEVPIPVEDDRYLANKVTVSVNGVTATYQETEGSLSTELPPDGVGVYGPNADSPLALNLASTDTATLLDQAAWRVHLGTVDEDRHPQIAVNLAHPSITPDMRRAILALRLGDRVQITNPPTWEAPDTIDQLVLGIDEEITHFEHRLTLTCAPASPYSYLGYLDTTSTRLDTDGSQLAADATSTATTLSLTVTDGPLWTPDPAELPFDIRVGGEVITVNAIGTVLNANPTFETNTSDWTATSATLTRSSTLAKRGTYSGLLTSTAGSNPRAESGLETATAAASYRAWGWLYAPQNLPSGVGVNVNWFDASQAYLSTSSNTAIPTVSAWTLFDAVFTAPALTGFATLVFTMSGTPGAGLLLYGDELRLIPVSSYSSSPQPFSVTRSINGVTKPQTAGTDVRLATPTIISL